MLHETRNQFYCITEFLAPTKARTEQVPVLEWTYYTAQVHPMLNQSTQLPPHFIVISWSPQMCLQQQSMLWRMALSRPRAFPSNREMAVFLDISAVRASSESLPAIRQSPWEDPKSTSWEWSLSGRSEDCPRRSPSNPMGLDADFRSAVAFADYKSKGPSSRLYDYNTTPLCCLARSNPSHYHMPL